MKLPASAANITIFALGLGLFEADLAIGMNEVFNYSLLDQEINGYKCFSTNHLVNSLR
jgi:hypothetical protein